MSLDAVSVCPRFPVVIAFHQQLCLGMLTSHSRWWLCSLHWSIETHICTCAHSNLIKHSNEKIEKNTKAYKFLLPVMSQGLFSSVLPSHRGDTSLAIERGTPVADYLGQNATTYFPVWNGWILGHWANEVGLCTAFSICSFIPDGKTWGLENDDICSNYLTQRSLWKEFYVGANICTKCSPGQHFCTTVTEILGRMNYFYFICVVFLKTF